MLKVKDLKISPCIRAVFGGFHYFFPKWSAFTLVELVVVLGIISLLSVFSLALVKQKQPRDSFERSLETLVSDIREAQNKAMTTEKCNNEKALYFGVRVTNAGVYEVYCQNASGKTISRTTNFSELSLGDVYFKPPGPTRSSGGENYQNFVIGQTTILINENGSLDIL